MKYRPKKEIQNIDSSSNCFIFLTASQKYESILYTKESMREGFILCIANINIY